MNLDLIFTEEDPVSFVETIVGKHMGVHVNSLAFRNTKFRKREFVLVRQIVMTIIKAYTRRSLTAVGEIYGKDHATVLHSKKTIDNLIDTDVAFSRKYKEIIHEIRMKSAYDPSSLYVCARCYSRAVIVSTWVDPNKKQIVDPVIDYNQPGYCYICGKETIVIKILKENYYENNLATLSSTV